MMSDELHITTDGVYALEWDSDSQQYTRRYLPVTEAILDRECCIDAGVTLKDIFRMVEQNAELARSVENWADCDISAFHEEARKPGARETGLTAIEIRKHFERGYPEAELFTDVSGIGPRHEGGHCRYALDFVPVNEIVGLPLTLNRNMEIFERQKLITEAPCSFTVLEVIGGIYWEISFYGGPGSRDRAWKEIAEDANSDSDEDIPLDSIDDLFE